MAYEPWVIAKKEYACSQYHPNIPTTVRRIEKDPNAWKKDYVPIEDPSLHLGRAIKRGVRGNKEETYWLHIPAIRIEDLLNQIEKLDDNLIANLITETGNLLARIKNQIPTAESMDQIMTQQEICFIVEQMININLQLLNEYPSNFPEYIVESCGRSICMQRMGIQTISYYYKEPEKQSHD